MANKAKLREILDILSPYGTAADFKAFDESVNNLKSGLRDKIQAKTLEEVNGKLARFRKSIDFEPILTALGEIETTFDARIKEVARTLAVEIAKFDESSKSEKNETSSKIAQTSGTIVSLRKQLDALQIQKDREIKDIHDSLKEIPTLKQFSAKDFADIRARLDQMDKKEANKPDQFSPLKKEVETLRTDLITKINNIPRHGDHANRNIAVGGNTSVLSRYTDVNLIAGANVTLTALPNTTTKYTDVTITATGGGGSFSVMIPTGTVNGINTVFVFTGIPSVVVLDNGNIMNKVSSDGTVNWTGTTTITLNQAPNFNIYGF